ncbi:uncharacterized protein LOC132631910 [Lycium barbarum]|uniref:uncharacterized protein LOC132631910 n=1 Tax=Lycium barbarum TaxID=112863 RepID=UPI00293F08C1|nr:uncharacterized protein LOC132631910 [Lycium barbarum]XP_060203628.1 uncharacterized protein LOC132631910 [Lycium barbarum]XP_060203629.1 uncharacterized protein LOC132631910 [Lycium barbarum]XP_060203630.1 uncharacterized protein LOC132631910 [Lycium barbarum]
MDVTDVTAVCTTLKEDFYAFKQLLRRFIRLMPLPDKVVCSTSEGLHLPHGVKCYFDLISNIKGSNMDYYKWLYNLPIFWNANKKGLFIGIMSRIMREFCEHSDECFKFKEIDNDWGTKKITQGVDPRLWNFYHYTDKAGNKNKNYQKDWGSTVYARNFLQHCKLGTRTFDLLEPVFPELISLIYKHFVEGITRGVYYDVHLSDGDDDDDDDDSDSDTEISLEARKEITSGAPSDDDDDGTKMAPTKREPKFISIDQFLWKEPSIFRLYDV